ncbi:MAG: 50S ribosomal protein L21 [Candidatus Shikimatogenerans sp. Tduv]|uniref:Large ribosomal subunit protein bL21 n=1 Tax=Candidatus Shikimatogenerans sp. Tduv TaxID=3158567 RepID=A0AAU7QRE2_9FLAO
MNKLAISLIKGFQYILYENKYIYISFLKKYKINDIYIIKKNLFYKNKKIIKIGYPYIKNVVIYSKILKHIKYKKILVYKKKRRKGYSKKKGYRSKLTKIKIISIKYGS